jgi:hypothetical protein
MPRKSTTPAKKKFNRLKRAKNPFRITLLDPAGVMHKYCCVRAEHDDENLYVIFKDKDDLLVKKQFPLSEWKVWGDEQLTYTSRVETPRAPVPVAQARRTPEERLAEGGLETKYDGLFDVDEDEIEASGEVIDQKTGKPVATPTGALDHSLTKKEYNVWDKDNWKKPDNVTPFRTHVETNFALAQGKRQAEMAAASRRLDLIAERGGAGFTTDRFK